MASQSSRNEIEAMLADLTSEEGRAQAILNLAGGGDVPSEYIDEAIETFRKVGRIEQAVELASKCDLTDVAIELCVSNDKLPLGAKVAAAAGMHEKARELYTTAVSGLAEAGDPLAAAKVASEAGMFEKAHELVSSGVAGLVDAGKIDEAVKVATDADLNEVAIRIYLEAGQLSDAARLAKETGDGAVGIAKDLCRQAVGALEKQQRIDEATGLARDWGLPEIAVDVYANAGKHGDAAELAVELGLTERAVDEYMADGNHKKAASVAEKAKLYEKAMEAKEKDGDVRSVAAMAEKSGNFEKAISLYREAGLLNTAIEVARKAHLDEIRLELLDEAGDTAGADLLRRDMKRKRLAEERMLEYEKAGQYKDAANAAREAGLKDKARSYRDLADKMKKLASQKPAEPEVADDPEPDSEGTKTPTPKRKRRRGSTSRVMRRFRR